MNNNEKELKLKSKTKLGLVIGFYNPAIIFSVITLYFVVFYFPYKFLPDYWHVSEIENFRSFIWSLLTVTLGFSGLILTLLLLSYNFFVKSTRRNTLEFIFDNIFLKILFSGFVSILLVQLAAFCMISKSNRTDKYAVIYFLLTLTVIYILAQLPIAILGLKYSTSMDKINKIFASIDHKDVEYLINTTDFLEKHSIEDIESNRFILLKDLGINAIKESDWILPQKIINNIYKLVPQSIKEDCPVATIEESIYIFLWVCKHFQRTAVKNGDQITVNMLVGQSLTLYHFIAENKIFKQALISSVDDYFKELIFSIIQSKDFTEIRDVWARDYVEVMQICVSALNYSDDELPTDHYIFHGSRDTKINYPTFSDYYRYWHHLIYTQSVIFTDVILFAMQQKDSRVYDAYYWQIRNLINRVESAQNLTASQKRQYITELVMRVGKIENSARDLGIDDDFKVVSHIEIERWARNGWVELYRSAIYRQSSTIKSLIKTGKRYNADLDEFFKLGRIISNTKNETELSIKEEILTHLLETGLKISENCGESLMLKYDIQNQLNWLFTNFLSKNEECQQITEKFEEKIKLATEGFDYYARPEF